MIETAADFETPLMMSSRFRFATDVLAARRMVEAGVIGDVLGVKQMFSYPLNASGNWRYDPAISGGGVLRDKGPQSFDLLRLFLGPLKAISVEAAGDAGSGPVEDSVKIHVRNAEGVSGHGVLSWRGGDEQSLFTRIEGSRGCIELGWDRSRMREHDGEWIEFGPGYNQQQAFRSQLSSFIGCVRHGDAAAPGVPETLATVALMDAGYASLRSGKWETPPI
jgi:predicted dehydrogenase